MSSKHVARVLIIQGHPDARPAHFGCALADAYAAGAQAAGHEVKRIAVSELNLPLLRTQEEWEAECEIPGVVQSQESIAWATHLVIFYPLWMGTMPAILKGFFEQVFRPNFREKHLLKGKTARIVITMGMPALVYRWYFGAHGLKNLERNILSFGGIKAVRATLIGMVAAAKPRRRMRWVQKMDILGGAAR